MVPARHACIVRLFYGKDVASFGADRYAGRDQEPASVYARLFQARPRDGPFFWPLGNLCACDPDSPGDRAILSSKSEFWLAGIPQFSAFP
jgi:hypothetical protein